MLMVWVGMDCIVGLAAGTWHAQIARSWFCLQNTSHVCWHAGAVCQHMVLVYAVAWFTTSLVQKFARRI